MHIKCLRLLWSLMVFATACFAQSEQITGLVADSSGAVIPQASVAVVNEKTGARRDSASNESGLFTVVSLQPGSYRVTVTKDGFKPASRTGVTLEVGQVARIDILIEIGSVTETIEVKETPGEVHLERDNNTLGSVVDSARVEDLPLNGRNFLQLALLAAGSGEGTGRGDQGQTGHASRVISVGGGKTSYTGYLINGISQRGSRLGELALNLSIANIDQFKVEQSFFLPDQGPNAGLVSVTTKAGTNQFHGQVFEFLRNKAFDARNFFSPTAEDLKRNQFGFGAGGPIVRNRLWVFGSYEGLREQTGFTQAAYTPTAAMFGGDFNQVAERIYDPESFSTQTGTRSLFPNQTIPNSRINAVSRNLLAYYLPGASLTQKPNNLFLNPRNTQHSDQWGVRLDAMLTSKQSIFGQFIHDNSPNVQGGLFPLSGNSYPNSTEFGMLEYTFTLHPDLVHTLRIGASRNIALLANEARPLGNVGQRLGIQNPVDGRAIPGVTLLGYAGFGNPRGDLGNLDNNYQLDEGLHYIRGSHQFKFGFGIRYQRTWQLNNNASAGGALAFQSTFTARLAPDAQGNPVPQANSGNSFADFLLGLPLTAGVSGLPSIPYRHTQFTPYVQDSWKVTRSFTLNYGMGWFLDTVPDPQGSARNLVHGFDPVTGLLTFASLGQLDPKVLAVDKKDFTPRLGFAWQPKNLPRTLIRAGAGIYYSDISFIDLQNALVGPPFNARTAADNSVRQPVPVYRLGLNIFPPANLAPVTPGYAASLPNGTAASLLREGARTPYVSQWNFSLQYALDDHDLITLDYQGSSAHRQQSRRQLASCIPGPDLYCNPATKPYPRYSDLQTVDNMGNISYEAVSVRYNHILKGGVDMRMEYHLSKALSDSYEITGFDNQIWTCRRCDKGFMSFDQRHRAVLSVIWNVPYGRKRHFGGNAPALANAVLGGWTATAIATFATGFPINMSAPNTTGTTRITHLPNRLCDGADANLADNLRTDGFVQFNRACFASPAIGYFGNSGRNPLHGPGRDNWDIGVHKVFPIRENISLQLRVETFNTLNHTQFGSPNGNVGDPANFGRVSTAALPRLTQLGLKLLW